jgi:hypothetical protein
MSAYYDAHDVPILEGVSLPVTLSTRARARGPIMRDGWPDRALRLSLLRGVLAAVVASSLLASSAAPAVAGEACVNAAVRAETGSTALPDCRGYEQVTSPYKEGFHVDPNIFLGFTDDGIVSYRSQGSFAGNGQAAPFNSYHATRSPVGWVSSTIAPSDAVYDTGNNGGSESADLRWSLWAALRRRDVPGDKLGMYLRSLDGEFVRIGDAEGDTGDDTLGIRIGVGASDDLSHFVFSHGTGTGAVTNLYEYAGTNNGHDAIPVSVDNHGQQTPFDTCFSNVSADGRVIVYTSGCGGIGGNPQLWARVAASATVAVSASECTRNVGDPGGACNAPSAATYAGAARDGSRVFFTTSQQLVNGDTDSADDLYACDILPGTPTPVGTANPCSALTEVSGTGNPAQVESIAKVSNDGSRVYFVAQGTLANNLGVNGLAPVAGDHNLYLWQKDDTHPNGSTSFVARLDAGSVARAQMTPDGRYLVFFTTSRLVTTGPGADNDDGAIDAYRYDATTRSIVRLSTSVSGDGGNAPGFDVATSSAMVAPYESRIITDDGSTVVFDTGEALSAADTDGVTDVYTWHDGRVSLISTGGGKAAGISSLGRDVFFTSIVPVLASDRDLSIDIYDARVGGGFSPTPQPIPCAGDRCRGQRSDPPSLPGPSSPTTVTGRPDETPPAFSLRTVSTAQRRALAATGKISLTVTSNAPGTVSVKATATIGSRTVTVGSARRTLGAPGKVAVSVSLSKSTRKQLAARGQLTVKIAVNHSKVALGRSLTVKLVHAKKRAKKSVRRRSAHQSIVGTAGGQS